MQNQWFFIFFSFVDNNQNSCEKFTDIAIHTVDHERKIQYDCSYSKEIPWYDPTGTLLPCKSIDRFIIL